MIDKYIREEANIRKRNLIIKLVFSFIILVLIGFSLWRFKSYILDGFSSSLAVIYPKEERNIQKFYNTYKAPQIGRKASPFVLYDLETKEPFDLGASRDYWVLLNFQITTCPTCISAESEIKKLEEKYDGRLKIISISIEDDRDKVSEYKKEYNINRLWLFDDKALVCIAYRVDLMPAWFLLDKNNVIQYINDGFLDHESIIKVFEANA